MVDKIGETTYWQDYCNLEPSARAAATETLSAAMVQAYVDLDEEFGNCDFMVMTWTKTAIHYLTHVL
jgi:hypothetical protein